MHQSVSRKTLPAAARVLKFFLLVGTHYRISVILAVLPLSLYSNLSLALHSGLNSFIATQNKTVFVFLIFEAESFDFYIERCSRIRQLA